MNIEEINIVETTGLAVAIMPDGTQWHVVATKHNRDWPGTDSPVTFAVYHVAWHNGIYGIVAAFGFFSEQDCLTFLTSKKEKKYTVKNLQGEDETVIRMGQGIHPMFVQKDIEDVSSDA